VEERLKTAASKKKALKTRNKNREKNTKVMPISTMTISTTLNTTGGRSANEFR
jgi:sRNA-binding protein